MSAPPQVREIRSPSNPLLVRLRRERRDPAGYRRSGELWLEGDHLCEAWLDAKRPVLQAVLSEGRAAPLLQHGRLRGMADVIVVPDALFEALSTLESPGGWALRVPAPGAGATVRAGVASLVLDRLQDPGNVGSLLRSAAALGFGQVLALQGTVALWAPKVLRAGMGAHFSLHLVEGLRAADLAGLGVPMVATGSHNADPLPVADLPWPLAWVLGHEGQGVDPAVQALCARAVAIPQPGGQESLNVAAAGAICLYESARRRSG